MEGTVRQLHTDATYFSELTSHNGEKGRLNETHLVRTLRRYLPDKFGIGTGFIVSGGEKIRQSSQCDIVIYDRMNNAPFYSSEAWQIFPIEMVYGVIEVKTKLTKVEIRKAFQSCAFLRSMCEEQGQPNKAYIRQNPGSPVTFASYRTRLPPRFFVFAYSGPKTTTLKQGLLSVTQEIPGAHLHGLCQLEKSTSVFATHEPYADPADRVRVYDDGNGLLQFLLTMPNMLNSMLEVVPVARFGQPNQRAFNYRADHFDAVDLDHYKTLKLRR